MRAIFRAPCDVFVAGAEVVTADIGAVFIACRRGLHACAAVVTACVTAVDGAGA